MRLFTSDAPQWSRLQEDKRAKVIKQNDVRTVYHLRWGEEDFFVKQYKLSSFDSRVKAYVRGWPNRIEFENLLLAREREIPAPRAVAWGQGKGFGLLVSQTIAGAHTLDEILLSDSPHDRDILEKAVLATASLVANVHCSGIAHDDLHGGNILVVCDSEENQVEAYLSDLQWIQATARSGHASADPFQKQRFSNMALLLCGIRKKIDETLLREFVRTYLQSLNRLNRKTDSQVFEYYQAITLEADKLLNKIYRKLDRRAARNSKYTKSLKLGGGWTARVFLQKKHPSPISDISECHFSVDSWQEALRSPERCLEEGSVVKQGSRSLVRTGEIELADRTFSIAVKQYRPGSGIKGWLARLRTSRGMRQWRCAHALITREIGTAWPLAVLEQRGVFLKQSIILNEWIPGDSLAKLSASGQLPEGREDRALLARQIGHFMARLRLKGIHHRDCKSTNIMISRKVDGFQIHLIDLDGVRQKHFPNMWPCHEALVRLAASMLRFSSATTVKDLLRAFHAYIYKLELCEKSDRSKRRQLWRTFTRQALAMNQKKMAKLFFGLWGRTGVALERVPFKNVLIVKPSSLGDVVRATPIVEGLHHRYPGAMIHWLVRPDCAEVLRDLPHLTGIIEFDRRNLGRLGRSWRATADFVKLVSLLREKHFDIVLDMQGLFRSAFLSWLTRAGICVGFANAREGASFFYTHKISIEQKEHIVESLWRFADALGFGEQEKTAALPVSRTACDSAKALLARHNLAPNQYVLFLVGGTEVSKRWPAERYGELASLISKTYDLPVVLVGAGSTEAELAAQVEVTCNGNVVNLVDKTTLSQVMAILQQAKLTIGNDSGPLHIAATFSVPLISLYGPTDPRIVGPYGQTDHVIEAGQNVSREHRYSKKPEHRIDNISVEQVWINVQKELGTG
jgi:heptosyltransferase-1